jgi:chromosome segregation ATPase
MPEETTRDLIVDRFDRLSALVQECIHRQKLTEARIESLDQKIEERLHDTRPIWEALQSRIDEMDQRIRVELREVGRQIGELRGEIDGLRAELHNEVSAIRTETASGFRAVERKIGILSKNLVDMTADIREIQDRLEQLETKPA